MMTGLLAEDGAILIARIEQIESQFRASCWAQLDERWRVQTESPEYHLTSGEEAARRWVHGRAAARGFRSIHWELD